MSDKDYATIAKCCAVADHLAKLIYDLLEGGDGAEAAKALEEGGWVDENGEWIYDDD